MGHFGTISDRLCPKCPSQATVWWAIAMDGYTPDMLTDRQRAVIARIQAEPESLMLTHRRPRESGPLFRPRPGLRAPRQSVPLAFSVVASLTCRGFHPINIGRTQAGAA